MAPVKSIMAASVLMAAQLVSGHAAITNAVGNAGGSGMALGIVSDTPRDGTRRNPFQQDATRFRGASAQSFGETVGQGANQLEAGTSKIMAETGDSLPQVTPGGSVTMTLHQVNADGAGPYTCMINADGTGTNWDNIQVTQNVEGNQRGRNNGGNAADHPLVAAIPANQQCSGSVAGQNNVCLVRCQNPARAGPFGGVVPVQMASAAGTAGAAPAAGNAGAGQLQNGAGQPQVANGQPQVANGQPQVANGQPQVANGRLQNGAGQTQAGASQPQVANGQPQVANGQPQVANGQPQVANGQPQVANGQPQVANSQLQTAAGRSQNNRRAIEFTA